MEIGYVGSKNSHACTAVLISTNERDYK